MQDLLLYIARSLVNNPDQVKVEVVENESSITLVLTVAAAQNQRISKQHCFPRF